MSLHSLCLTHRVTFQEPTITLDASAGQQRQTWADVATLTNVPCTIQPLTAKERVLYAQRQILMTDRLFLSANYASLIKRHMRIKDLSTLRYYHILNWMDQAGRRLYVSVDLLEFSD